MTAPVRYRMTRAGDVRAYVPWWARVLCRVGLMSRPGESVVIYRDGGPPPTIAFIDTDTALPTTPPQGDIMIDHADGPGKIWPL